MPNRRPGNGTSNRRSDASTLTRARLGAILVAAASELVYVHAARAADDSGIAEGWRLAPIRGSILIADQSVRAPVPPPGAATDPHAPTPSPPDGGAPIQLAATIDHINVPSPEVSKADAAMAADAHTIGPISQQLHSYQLTPAQLISVRNYIGQYDEHTKVSAAGPPVDGVSTFTIKDADSGAVTGQVQVSAGANGEVVVSKTTSAVFEQKTKVEIPLLNSQLPQEEAQQVLGGSTAYNTWTKNQTNQKSDMELPAIVSVETHTDLGTAKEATAHFYPDGSGYEYGLTSKVASEKAEVKVGVEGVDVGAGVRGPEAGAFVNYFGKLKTDDSGAFTRSVVGAAGDVHMTLADVEAKLGCPDEGPCGAKAAAGAMGLGGGLGLSYSPYVKIPVRPANEIPDEGIAEAPPPPPAVSSEDQAAYDAAVASGDPDQLQTFIDQHPDSPLADDADDKIDMMAAPEPDQPMPETGY